MRRLPILLGAALLSCHPVSDGSSTDEQALQQTGETSIERVQVADLKNGQTAILVTLSSAHPPESIPWNFQGEDLQLNDRGWEADEESGDGVYTGVSSRSIEPLLEARERYTAKASQWPKLRANRFAGHGVKAIAELAPNFLQDVDKEPVVLSNLGGQFTALTTFPAVVSNAAAFPPPPVIDPYKTQMIVSPKVVYNPDLTGTWGMVGGQCKQLGNPDGIAGFRYLMGEVASGYMSADKFVSDWVNTQAVPRTVNGYTVDSSLQGVYLLHNGSNVFANPPVPWPKLYDDGSSMSFTDILDARQTPLQLIAIVNRFDLAAGGYGGTGAEAELRFVFTFINEETCKPGNGTVILEYAVPLDTCGDIEHWAKMWSLLDNMSPASPVYWNHLSQEIIKPVVVAGAGAGAGRPNNSNLKVLRTNEQELLWPHYTTDFPADSTRDWRMEEWAVDVGSHTLKNQVLAQTPGFDWVDPDTSLPAPYAENVDVYIDNFVADIVAGVHQIPLTYGGSPFASPQVRYGNFGESAAPYNVPFGSSHTWRAMSFGSANLAHVEARQLFSLTTCSGCHAGEAFEDGDGAAPYNDSNWHSSIPGGTLERPFQHVEPDSTLGQPAHLSRFLTGTNNSCSVGAEFVDPLGPLPQCMSNTCCPIGDPVFGYEKGQVHYNEFARRGAILESVLLNGCSALKTVKGSVIVSSAH